MGEYVLTLLAAAAVTYLLTPAVRRFAIAVGALHAARDRDVHVVPTPLLGGFAMYAGLAAGLLVASRIPALTGAFAEPNMSKGLLLAGGLVVIMGFVDDRWGLGALSKLAGQVAAGVILVWSGAEVTWLPLPGGSTLGLTTDQQTAATILVVVVTINAVNFIDGLDGLAAGIVGIGAAAFFIYYYTLTHRLGLPDQTGPALASAVLVGICIGFLPHNFYPARIFMGDTGAMLLGLLLAYAPIASLASLDPASLTDHAALAAGTVNRFGAILPLLVPAAIMLIPYADLLMAVVRRTRAGTSVFSPDKKHLQHRLLAIGHSHRASVLIMYLWATLFAGSVVWLSIVRTSLYVLIIVTGAAVLALALLLVSMPRLRPWARAKSGKSAARQPVPGVAPAVVSAMVPSAVPVADTAERRQAWAASGQPAAEASPAAGRADPEETRPIPAMSWLPSGSVQASPASPLRPEPDEPVFGSRPVFGTAAGSPFGSGPVTGKPTGSPFGAGPVAAERSEPPFEAGPRQASSLCLRREGRLGRLPGLGSRPRNQPGRPRLPRPRQGRRRTPRPGPRRSLRPGSSPRSRRPGRTGPRPSETRLGPSRTGPRRRLVRGRKTLPSRCPSRHPGSVTNLLWFVPVS